jgi:hypothetical protein
MPTPTCSSCRPVSATRDLTFRLIAAMLTFAGINRAAVTYAG